MSRTHGGVMGLRGVVLATSALSTAVLGLMGVGWAAMTPPQPSGATIGPPVTVSPQWGGGPTASPRRLEERIGTAVEDRRPSAGVEGGSETDDATPSPETIAPTLVRPTDDDRPPGEGDGDRHDDD